MSGNAISEVELEADTTNILEPESSTAASTETSEVAPMPILPNNNLNETTNNNGNIGAGQNEDNSINGNKFTIPTTDEDEIIEKIEEKTKLGKDEIKRAIKFKKKEPVKEDIEEGIEEITTVVQQAPQLDYITKVNGSIILRLG